MREGDFCPQPTNIKLNVPAVKAEIAVEKIFDLLSIIVKNRKFPGASI